MAYFSNKPPPTPGEQLPMPHSATAAIVKEPELKPSLKRKNVEKSEAGMCICLTATLLVSLCIWLYVLSVFLLFVIFFLPRKQSDLPFSLFCSALFTFYLSCLFGVYVIFLNNCSCNQTCIQYYMGLLGNLLLYEKILLCHSVFDDNHMRTWY